MSIQEIIRNSKEGIPEYPNKRKSGDAEMFQESLIRNLKSQDQGCVADAAGNVRKHDEEAETEIKECRNEDRTGVGVTGNAARIRVNEVTKREAVHTAEVRRMSYEESDNIEIAVTEGYTLKGKLEGRQVYVEAKYEDGRLEAYQVDTDKVPEQTQYRIERFALETVDSVKS
ncbi:MAG: hypothetical protein HDR28_11355 [Lachnospiraceae bacterium]|nr:hypothetical protein [Lachnospiraceae bacterium]